MKFTEYIKEEHEKTPKNEVIALFIEALKNIPSENVLNQFEAVNDSVRDSLQLLNDSIDTLDFEIQNTNNSLSQELITQKEKDRTSKITEREAVNKVKIALDKMLPSLKRFFTNASNQKNEYGLD